VRVALDFDQQLAIERIEWGGHGGAATSKE
jgi:hypothetical protein